jgi:acetylglutamate kinase
MEIIVLKVGGSVLAKLPDSFYKMVVSLREQNLCQPVIVHGGGPEINEALKQFSVETEFIDGLRVTTKEVLDIAQMVMCGSISKTIVGKLQKAGGTAIGLSGIDGSLLQAIPVDAKGTLGFVGQVAKVNTSLLDTIIEYGSIPVISPIGVDQAGSRYNINGDTAAAAVAQALEAKLALISDIPGVMEEISGEEIVHDQLTQGEIEAKIASGIIYGGMIPKVRSALKGLSGGVRESVILNGLNPEDLKKFIEGKQAGTKVIQNEEVQHV